MQSNVMSAFTTKVIGQSRVSLWEPPLIRALIKAKEPHDADSRHGRRSGQTCLPGRTETDRDEAALSSYFVTVRKTIASLHT